MAMAPIRQPYCQPYRAAAETTKTEAKEVLPAAIPSSGTGKTSATIAAARSKSRYGEGCGADQIEARTAANPAKLTPETQSWRGFSARPRLGAGAAVSMRATLGRVQEPVNDWRQGLGAKSERSRRSCG